VSAFGWVSLSNPVAVWWLALSAVSALNIALWFRASRLPGRNRLMLGLSAVFVFGCALRAVYPKGDVQRLVLFDTWLSSVAVGRSVATFAELAFVAQWALVLAALSKDVGSRFGHVVSRLMVPLIFVAECFSWYAVATTNYVGNAIEESLWTTTFSLFAIALCTLIPASQGRRKLWLSLGALGSFLYVCFMVGVDVPMYFTRWRGDVAAGKTFFGLGEGLYNVATTWHVSYDISEWREEMPWMSLYFSAAVWASLAVACQRPGYLNSKVAR
jgi:hypothetical protein